MRVNQSVRVNFHNPDYKQLRNELRQEGFITQPTLIAFAGMPLLQFIHESKDIAREMGRNIYRIDLNQITSKYIGETEKNLDAIFRRAETASWLLEFDDADALFGERTEPRDSHDRFAKLSPEFMDQLLQRRVIILALFKSVIAAERRRKHVRHLLIKYP
jgi:SpoVK/Ycf46/Vps4 family AAA+-type ATPase